MCVQPTTMASLYVLTGASADVFLYNTPRLTRNFLVTAESGSLKSMISLTVAPS